jgi:hypothetical protein
MLHCVAVFCAARSKMRSKRPNLFIEPYGGIPVEDRRGALIAAIRDKDAAVTAGLGHGPGRDAWV